MDRVLRLLLTVTAVAAVLPAASVKPKLAGPLFEKQKKIKATVSATGEATLEALVGSNTYKLMTKQITDSGDVEFYLTKLDEETVANRCWTGGVIKALDGSKLTESDLRTLKNSLSWTKPPQRHSATANSPMQWR